jgi:uncharacterized lipoprotein
VRKIGFCLVCMACLASCTTKYASNDKQQYLSSRNGVRVELPEHLTNTNMSDFYELPTPEGPKKVSVAPPQV